MLRKALNYAVILLSCALLLLAGFALGSQSAERRGVLLQTYPPASAAAMGTSTEPDLTLFWETWKLIDDEYLKSSEISSERRVQGAMAGLMASLGDPYSEYFNPHEAETFKSDVAGKFGGIGAQLGIRDDTLVVITPMKDSPAEKAGVKSGDQILMIDSTSTQGFSTDKAVDLIRGKVGTTVKLTIMREDFKEPKELTITRANIVVPTIDFEMKKGGVAYIHLYQFNDNANQLFAAAVRKAALASTKGMVLDLRGNPGGYLDVSVDLAGWLLPRGTVVVSQQGRSGAEEEIMRANGNAALAKAPIVILIDEGSASAAEILAGALRDQRQAPLVGKTSFGKGTVQEIKSLQDGSVVKLTVAHWVLPSGHILEEGGLKPDYEVELTEDDMEKKNDPQLDKALQVLRDLMH